ncbi:MAG: hypothetical protein AB1630_05195 [bacterium]
MAISLELYKTIESIVEEKTKGIKVDREEFNLLTNEVRKLAIAQRELVEAQKKSEERLTKLEIVVGELAEAQKRTEEELKTLSEEVKALTEDVRALTVSHKDLAKQVGGISHTVGYGLEDKSYEELPRLLEKDFGIMVKESLRRRYVKDKEGKYIQVNIIGNASKNGKRITIIGEGKSQLSKNDVDDFIRKKLKRLEGVFDNIFPLLITYMTSEYDVEEYAKKKGISLYYSYDF